METSIETGTSSQTDITMNELTYLFNKLSTANASNKKLEENNSKLGLTEKSFFANDIKTKYLTGLNKSKVLFSLHAKIAPWLSDRSNTALSTFQQLIVTL